MIDPALLTDEFFEELEQYILKPKKEKSFTVLSTKKSKSDCGANAEGGGGFQPGNTCAAGDGEKSGGSKVNPKVLAWAKKHFGDDETAQNFAEWFGDSKAVDEDGNPLLLYHGTDADVDGDFEFQKSRIGSKTDSGFYGSGFYLTPWKSEANYYASKVHAFYAQMENPVVIHGPNDPLLDVGMVEQWERYRPRLEAAGLLTPKYKEALDYLAAKKKHITPLIKTYQMGNGPDADETGWLAGIDDDSLTFDSGLEHGVHLHKPVNFEWMDDGRRKNIYYESAEAAKKALLAKAMFQALEIHGRKGGVSRLPTMSDYFRTELTSSQITEKAKANGFDSVIFGDEHLVFEPEQVKSATLNNGKFDPKDGRVGKSFSVVAIKSSDCGANAEGGGGFQEGNTCAAGDGEGKGSARKAKAKAALDKYTKQVEDLKGTPERIEAEKKEAHKAWKEADRELVDTMKLVKEDIESLRLEGESNEDVFERLGEGDKAKGKRMVFDRADKLKKKLGVPELQEKLIEAKLNFDEYGHFGEKGRELYRAKRDLRLASEKLKLAKIANNPKFQKWYGDSVNVDGEGLPVVIYHGTEANVGIDEFDASGRDGEGVYGSTDIDTSKSYSGGYTDDVTPVLATSIEDVDAEEVWGGHSSEGGGGFHSSKEAAEAAVAEANKERGFEVYKKPKRYLMLNDRTGNGWERYYTGENAEQDLLDEYNSEVEIRHKGSGVYPLFFKMENPLVVDGGGANWSAIEVPEYDEEGDFIGMYERNTREISYQAKRDGHDGVIFRDIEDYGGYGDGGGGPADVFVVFDPDDIKSVHNAGTFDESDNILKSFNVMAIKSSDCGANAEGGGGFQEGNTCAAGGSDSENKKHEKFLKWFDSQGWDHPFMRGARAWGLKHEDGTEGTVYVKMYPSVNKDAVHISEIFAHPTGKGFGTAILERITEEADKQGVTLDLSAVPFGEDKMPSQDLIEYYRKHGFRPRGKGFAEDELVRKPKKKSKSFGVAVIKSSDCGANAEGGGGFQIGNTCAAGEGSSKTETREFREWFGDSKVVDEDGRPLVVFHGTNREFNSFSHDAEQQNDAGFAGEGFYFMSSKEWGDGYAEVAVDNSGGEARTIEAYLRIENPKVISDYQEVIKGRDIRESGVARAVAKEIRESGHDGVILMPKKKGGPREYMVLDPVQIKSATNNRGTFDPSDPDITKSFSLKSSDCGANAEGGGGFQIGNTCASKDNKVTESTIGLKGAMNEIEERTGKKFPKDEADQMAHVVSLHEKGKITKTQRDKYFKELERYFEEDMKARGFGAAESMFPAPKNVKVSERATINKGSALKELGLPEDIDVKKLALVAGVGDDAQVSVEYRSKDITFHVTDGYKSQSKLYKDNDGDFVIYNRYMEVKKRGQGLGTEVLQRQVEAASRMGVSKLKGVAVRREGTTGVPLVGYYVWPRLGYDGKLTDLHKKALPKELSEYDPEMVSDLMMSKKGRDWWRANGSTFNVEFDLSKNSWGRKTLERLIRKKREGKE